MINYNYWHGLVVCCTKFNFHFKLSMTTLAFFIIVIVVQTHVSKNTSKKGASTFLLQLSIFSGTKTFLPSQGYHYK